MRAFRRFAAGLGAGLLAVACSKDSAGPKPSPTANFAASCSSLECNFTDQSTDTSGTIAAWHWGFGDGATSTDRNPTHTYTVTKLDTITTTLTVTDNDGATSTASKNVTVAPPAQFMCNGVGCDVVLDQNSIVTVTLQSSSCRSHGDTFVLTSPMVDTLFKDGCYVTPVPQSFQLNGGNAFNAGTHLQAEVLSGSTALAFPPTIRVTGTFPNWQLNFDDGEGCSGSDPTCGGLEPDFNDLVITIVATPQ